MYKGVLLDLSAIAASKKKLRTVQTAITSVEHGEVEIWTGLVSKEGIPEDKVGWCRNEGCEDQFEWLRRVYSVLNMTLFRDKVT